MKTSIIKNGSNYFLTPLKHKYYNGKTKLRLPDKLIYKRAQFEDGTKSFHKWEEFVVFSPNKDSSYGLMVCQKLKYSQRKDYTGPTLGIDYLISKETDKNFGSTLINFAKNYSKQIGCGGYLLLKADSSFTPQRTPHVFYRKLGFGTDDKKIDKKLDTLIKKGQISNHKDFRNMLMFYPPIYSKKELFFSKVLKKLQAIFGNF